MQIDKVDEPITLEPHDGSAMSLEQRGGGGLISRESKTGRRKGIPSNPKYGLDATGNLVVIPCRLKRCKMAHSV
jgi:hypothetical protein